MSEPTITMSLDKFDDMRRSIELSKEYREKVERMLVTVFNINHEEAFTRFRQIEDARNKSDIRRAVMDGKI